MDSSRAGKVSGVCWLPVDPHGEDTYVMECLRFGLGWGEWGREYVSEKNWVGKTVPGNRASFHYWRKDIIFTCIEPLEHPWAGEPTLLTDEASRSGKEGLSLLQIISKSILMSFWGYAEQRSYLLFPLCWQPKARRSQTQKGGQCGPCGWCTLSR